ncbi:Zn-ribbon domain-containing OB-fold protein [Candidatus Bathyarchaeota archaeon]|nr:Zn-ribbon domain-containing OB-fold protein [Candidatus Bathyarchaeota archaeon]
MNQQTCFTIEEFYRNLRQKRLMGGKCRSCGKVHVPPRPLCDQCLSKDFEWVELPKTGKLLTYTVIHVAPQRFQEMVPYAVGIVQLENGVKLPGIIKDVQPEKLKIGMTLTVDFEASPQAENWPQWPRYCFKIYE